MCAIKILLACLSTSLALSWRDVPKSSSSISHHLSSRTLYKNRRRIPDAKPFDEPLPENNTPTYLYLVARHGTRWPTKKRMNQYASLETVLKEADTGLQPWTRDWKSPFQNDTDQAGFLHPIGEAEMRGLGQRFQKQFPQLLPKYQPHHHKFISTQVPRASASAIAFTQGLFPCESPLSSSQPDRLLIAEKGSQQCCVPQPTALSMRPKNDDPLLRFFDLSKTFDQYIAHLEPLLEEWEREMWTPLVEKIRLKLGLQTNVLSSKDIGSLWQVCEQEASLLGTETRACSLFDAQDVELMEYVEDSVGFAKKGHLCPEAYVMASKLLQDINSMLSQGFEGHERARFHFAHAETLGPLAAALGLFGAVQHKPKSMACTADWKGALPRDPEARAWWCNTVMPFGANIALLLHSSNDAKPSHSVRMYYNEQVIPIPACPDQLDCPLEIFLEYLEERASLG